jgi:tripartite ATP-independent transporter DctP family solute receptor
MMPDEGLKMNKKELNAKTRIIFGVLTPILILSLVFATCNKHITGEKIIIKVAHNGNEKHPHQAGFETFKEVLEKETNGKVEVQIFPNEQLGSEEEASQMVKLGLLSASAASAGGGLASFVSEAELFNLPFIFRDLEHFYRVLDGPTGQRVARAVEEKLNCKVLGYWYSGIRNAWNSKRPILTPEDLKGLKIRVMSSPILLQTFNALGAQATPMAFGELYSALQMGVVDGAETDHIDLLYEKFHEVTKHVSYTNHMFLAVGLIFSKKQFDRLPRTFNKCAESRTRIGEGPEGGI